MTLTKVPLKAKLKLVQVLGQNINPSLKRISLALERIKNPQNAYKSIHIVGTNGKGSVTTFLELLYLHFALGKIGKYISPHLVSFTERISVNGQDITEEEFDNIKNELFNENSIFNPFNNGFLSPFEKLTLIAFEYFKRKGVEIAILEAGLGARWDATNTTAAENRLATVLTNVGWDHMDYLGNSLEEIRAEKETIKRDGVPHYEGESSVSLENVSVIASEAKQSTLPETGRHCEEDGVRRGNPGTDPNAINGVNFLLALRVFEDLTKIKVSDSDKAEILARFKSRYKGRFSYDAESGVLVDGAHNAHGAKALNAFMQKHNLVQVGKIFVLAFLDKDVNEIITELFIDVFDPARDLVICTQVDSDRATSARELSEIIENKFPNAKIIVESNPGEAFNQAQKRKSEKDLLVITGSLYLLGEYYSRS